MYSLYHKKKEDAERVNAELLAKRRALLNLSPRSKDRRLKSIYGLTRNEMATKRSARVESFMTESYKEKKGCSEREQRDDFVNVRFVTGAGDSIFHEDFLDTDAPETTFLVTSKGNNSEKGNINPNLRGTIYEKYPEEPGLHAYQIRSRNREKELKDHPKNGWISAQVYIPRAVYKGGGVLDCVKTKELLGFKNPQATTEKTKGGLEEDSDLQNPNRSRPIFSKTKGTSTQDTFDFDSIYAPAAADGAKSKKQHIVSTTFPLDHDRRGKLVDGMLPRRCTTAPVDSATIRGRNTPGEYTINQLKGRERVKSAEISSTPFHTVVKGKPNGLFAIPSPRPPGSEFDLAKLKGNLGYYKNDSMKYSSYKEVQKQNWKGNTFRLIVKNPKGSNREFNGNLVAPGINVSETYMDGASKNSMRERNPTLDIDQSNNFSTALPQDIRLSTNYQNLRQLAKTKTKPFDVTTISAPRQKYEYAITMKNKEYPQMKLYKASLIGARK